MRKFFVVATVLGLLIAAAFTQPALIFNNASNAKLEIIAGVAITIALAIECWIYYQHSKKEEYRKMLLSIALLLAVAVTLKTMVLSTYIIGPHSHSTSIA